jgi:group I intron endonuclease
MASGIYAIDNAVTGMIYIGQAGDIEKRWQSHVYDLNRNKHGNRHLQTAWNQNGAGAFKFSVLEECPIQHLNEREQHYLDTYVPLGFCYNIRRKSFSSAGALRKLKAQQVKATVPNHVTSADLDDYEKVLIRLSRKGDRLRFLYYLAAVSKTDDELIEFLEEVEIEIAKRTATASNGHG